MTNKNFGKLIDNKLEYAPSSFKTSLGIITNPPAEFYLQKGYYSVINNKPAAVPGCFVKLSGYDKDDEQKTITVRYVQQLIPIEREFQIYSKLKLEAALFNIDKSLEFDMFLNETMLSNDYGSTTSLRKFYESANDLRSNNPYFETYYKLAKEALEIDDETARGILSNCIMEY